MPRDCLGIIESKSKVRYSRNKPVITKVSTTASTSGVSPDVAELKDMVRALLLDKKDHLVFLLCPSIKIINETIKTASFQTKIRIGVTTSSKDLFTNPRFSKHQLIRPQPIKLRLLKHKVFRRRISLFMLKPMMR
uniref:Reverse transcriptase domain-containing protein n=1 Tax=Tanacetum cinerariifolium TaxID=118510 RepID=A0A699V6T3_TANCI|nr:hypothetical protein [Tanacetum cinerariifolium]